MNSSLSLAEALAEFIEADASSEDPFTVKELQRFILEDAKSRSDHGRGWFARLQSVYDRFEGDPVDLTQAAIAYKKIAES